MILVQEEDGMMRQVTAEDIEFWSKFGSGDKRLLVHDRPEVGMVDCLVGRDPDTDARYRVIGKVSGIQVMNDEGSTIAVRLFDVPVLLTVQLLDSRQFIPAPGYRRPRSMPPATKERGKAEFIPSRPSNPPSPHHPTPASEPPCIGD